MSDSDGKGAMVEQHHDNVLSFPLSGILISCAGAISHN